MTLNQTITAAKKTLLGIGLSIIAIILLVVIYRLGIIVKNMLFPQKAQPANHLYNVLPTLQFPQNATSANLSYTINTVTGALPDFSDRIDVFQIIQAQPNLLNLNKAKTKAQSLGFIGDDRLVLPEINLDNINYEWVENKGLERKLTINTINFNFSLYSNYLSSLSIINSQGKFNQTDAVTSTKNLLADMNQMPNDIDLDKTTTPQQDINYITNPQLFSIQNSKLVPTTSLSKTSVMRVDWYQKDLNYDLNTGLPAVTGGFKKIKTTLPILYPHPPYSTMNFFLAAGPQGAQVVAANFVHMTINSLPDIEAVYPIKTAQEAFDELKNGKGYIAAYSGSNNNISINKIYLAYYLGENEQQYLMPIIVFEGDNGFFAYISAVKNEWVK